LRLLWRLLISYAHGKGKGTAMANWRKSAGAVDADIGSIVL
jgi:hypothetical protein